MTNVHSLTGTTGEAAKALNAEILRMGGATEHGPMKAADAFYDIVSGVSDATTHMAILSNAMKTATAGQADLKATTSAMVGIMNAYSFSADKAYIRQRRADALRAKWRPDNGRAGQCACRR